jgi:hypothetical protein
MLPDAVACVGEEGEEEVPKASFFMAPAVGDDDETPKADPGPLLFILLR